MTFHRSGRMATLFALVGVLAACSSGKSAIDAGNDNTTSTTVAATATEPAGTVAPATTPGTGSTPGTATGDSAPGTTTPATTVPIDEYPACPVDALDGVTEPVEITFWHGFTTTNADAMTALVDEYNASQTKVRVNLQAQGSYLDVLNKYYASGESSRPDMVQFPEYGFQQAIDSHTFIPAEACIRAEGYDTSGVLTAARAEYAQAGVQWGMPFNTSDVLVYYNRKAFAAAGLDPDKPPATFDDLRAFSQQLVDTGAAATGIAYDTNSLGGGGWFLEQWFANSGEPYVNNGNGRDSRATEVLFGGDTGVKLYSTLQSLAQDGLLVNVGDNAGGFDSYLKLADKQSAAAMVFGSSASLGTVMSVLGSGQIEGLTPDDVGVGPLPSFSGEPSAVVGGAANYIVAGHGDEKAAAVWDFIKFLLTPEAQSEWAAATCYIPIVDGAVDVEPLKTTYAEDPRFRVAFDQLAASPDDVAHAGAVMGPYLQVRAVTAGALATILGGADVEATLADAVQQANSLLEQYNSLNG